MEQGHFSLAETLLRRSLKHAPHHATTWTNLGLLAIHRSNTAATPWSVRQTSVASAKRAFETALRNVPGHTMALHGLGKVALIKGDPRAAEAFFRHATKAPRDTLSSVQALALLLWRSARPAEARQVVQDHGQRFPAHRAAIQAWAKTHLR
ncbi:MAG: tetratricopeptide repeat protein [Deltaproteobacteria bacterium]|nr:tetratricopeptide repeat protein [Deltaproteobacteria bacterium]